MIDKILIVGGILTLAVGAVINAFITKNLSLAIASIMLGIANLILFLR